ncbi:MAG: CRISPR-associated endonuclease Cas1 [Verrucomicrobiota bacterium]
MGQPILDGGTTEAAAGLEDGVAGPGEGVFDRAVEILRKEGVGQVAPSQATGAAVAREASDGRLPARMLNEFVYCPRLFYYEHVEGVFVESADTIQGAAIHKRVDSGTGALPGPVNRAGEVTGETSSAGEDSQDGIGAPEVIHSRSVTLGSDRLGVLAKLDLVEVEVDAVPVGVGKGGAEGVRVARGVVPVDYKLGKPREAADGNELWPTDQMQLGVQILLLRENGYACNEGVIYYRATRQRVRFELTPEREAWVLRQIEAARATMQGPIPPPLVGSPKCRRCSLAPVCLPDETRMLAESRAVEPTSDADGTPGAADGPSGPTGRAGDEAPRRLMAARDDRRALYLNTPGLRVGRKDETLTVKADDQLLDEVRMMDVSHVALFGNIQVSTQAIQALCDAEIPVTYFSGGGWFYGITHGHGLKNVFLRIEQFRLARDPDTCLRMARAFVHGKIRNHRTLLMRNHVDAPASALTRLKYAAADALKASSLAELLGIAGAAAAAYFEHFQGMLRAPDPNDDDLPGAEVAGPRPKPLTFEFHARHRRPPTDPVNAMLSLAYSVLSKDCTIAAAAVGFDPYVGFYHQPRFGRPAMALDLMEEFRPLVAESVVLTAVNNRMVTPSDFVSAGQSVNLTPAGRKRFFMAYEQRMSSLLTHPLFDYKVSYRRALELQARILAKALTGEIPEYVPLLTR